MVGNTESIGVREEVAKALGLKKEDVACHVTFLGGGFGRKSKPDYAVEAAVLSKKTGKPVKVVWSREDDIKFDYYHSVAAMYIKAAVPERQADGLAATLGVPADWIELRKRFGVRQRGRNVAWMGCNSLRCSQFSDGEWSSSGARAHRVASIGSKYLSCVRGPVVCQRTSICGESRSLRVPDGVDWIWARDRGTKGCE